MTSFTECVEEEEGLSELSGVPNDPLGMRRKSATEGDFFLMCEASKDETPVEMIDSDNAGMGGT